MTDPLSPPPPVPPQPAQPNLSPQVVLPQAVEQWITALCDKHNKPHPDPNTRRVLASLEEETAVNILRKIFQSSSEILNLNGYIIFMVKKYTPNASPSSASASPTTSGYSQPNRFLNASPSSASASPTTSGYSQPNRFLNASPSYASASASPTTSGYSHPNRSHKVTPTRLMMNPQSDSSPVQSPVPMKVEEGCRAPSSNGISPEQMALGELEFRKAFLILSYLGGKSLEEVLSAGKIQQLKDFPMRTFESEVWKAVGCICGFIKEYERPKHSVDWNSGGAHIYHCHVYPDGTYRFKGPFLGNVRNFLQRSLGDDNVLMVKFAEKIDQSNSTSSSSDCYYQLYEKFLREGILVGLRRYRFFVFKDGGKEEKRKDPTTSCVKCFFVRMESNACSDSPDYILSGKTVREARSIFMHLDTLEKSLSNYMARFSLVLSKTLNVDIDLSCVEVEEIDDIMCQDEKGIVKDQDGKPCILTDGTGFISADLAVKCPKNIFKGSKKAHNIEGKFSESRVNEPPLLIQFRLFNKGSAVKGTLLVNKKLPPKTIQVRPSMIKVKKDPNLSDISTKNSLEVVGTSNRPKQAYLSKMLILLLSYGGVPEEFFMDSLCSALDDAKDALMNKRAALRVALNNGGLDDFSVARMILSGIPLEESFLQHRLSFLINEEKKSLKRGKIPVDESYYLMGTADPDPTGLLKEGEVCIILDNGQISGKVLVYRNPGLHFGDIHILNAKYVDRLEGFVGNAKYAIFFPCKGKRSIADEIAGGDYDGDLYFVSRNPQLLEKFTEGERWISSSPATNNVPNKKPREFSDKELEDELFKLFLNTRFNPSYTVGVAADSWLAMMDRFTTLGESDDNSEEKRHMKDNMCRLIDIYYDALDAPKSGKKVELPNYLKVELFPHYMERKPEISYKSTSIMGLIYDKVKSFELEALPEIEVWKLPCFSDPVPGGCLLKWDKFYEDYRREMNNACQITNKDYKDEACENVKKKYKEILYEAAEFEESRRPLQDIFDEARAIYNIVYDYASRTGVEKCGFAWSIAGSALCRYYLSVQNEQPMICSASTLKEILS